MPGDNASPLNDSVSSFKPEFDKGVTKVMILASALIVFSMLLIGTFVYQFTEREVVKKLKSKDLVTMAEAISLKVDARIDKAVETSLSLAHDPILLEWLASGEQDEKLAKMLFEKTGYYTKERNYSTAFIVSEQTLQYWDQNGGLVDQMSMNDPDDKWFFDSLASGHAAAVNFDYNKELGDTFAFVNTLVGSLSSPSAVVGVGMNLHKLSDDFAAYKDGRGINLWLIDKQGMIYLSDAYEDNGKNLRDIIAESGYRQVLGDAYEDQVQVIEYKDQTGKRLDLISYPLLSTDLNLLVEIERQETIAFLQTIKWNTVLAVSISILAIVFFFFYISRKLANPYKRTLELNQHLEEQVVLRTKELSERNQDILDSINYAKLLQQSVLPTDIQLQKQLEEHFVIWRPRDVVGGDFYWMKKIGDQTLIAVGDCTGHGVPGAFMTLLAVSALNRIVDKDHGIAEDPASILGQLNRLLKETLHQEDQKGITDDGLDLGLCLVGKDQVVFAGAACSLYRLDDEGLHIWKGDRKSIGYRRTPEDYSYTNHMLPAAGAKYYMTTDGFYDQNGGDRDYSFNKNRFAEMIVRYGSHSLEEQRELFVKELETYMGGERQRDDITVVSFRTSQSFKNEQNGGGLS
jgi:serine phosphatase RsbU (regulator of sigma subunit)